MYGTINTTAQGCVAGEGLGKGMASTVNCSATGGSHGGIGGYAINKYTRSNPAPPFEPSVITYDDDPFQDKMCQYFAPVPYGDYYSSIVLEGSGGGRDIMTSSKSGGQGGGIIWI